MAYGPVMVRRAMLAGMAGLPWLRALAASGQQDPAGLGRLAGPQPGLEQIDFMVRSWMADGGYPGAGLIVEHGGKRLIERYYGAYDAHKAVHVASAGKWFVAATIAALVDAGALGWEDPAGKWVSGLQPAMAAATLRQLLSHTAGYPDYQPPNRPRDHYATLALSVDHVRSLSSEAPPGTRFHYGGLAMQVAGRMAEEATGSSWEALFQTRIAQPLGMRRSAFTPVPAEEGFAPMLGGSVRTTAADTIEFLQMIAHGGYDRRGHRLLSAKALAAMCADQVGTASVPPLNFVDQARADPRRDVYGLGQWREEVDALGEPTLLSSPGWAGAYPWLDRRTGSYGMFIAKVDVPQAARSGFNAFLSSPTLAPLVRDAIADAGDPATARGYVAVPGGRLYWEAAGSGDPLILLHGHSFDRTMWDPQFAALRMRFRVIRYDLRGYGRSSLPTEGVDFLHAGDLVRLMDALGIRRAHLVGLSLGGAVATDMLALHPDRLRSVVAASGDIFDLPAPDEPWTAADIARRRREIAALRARGVWQYKRGWLDDLTAHGGPNAGQIRPKLWEMISKWSAWQPLHVEPRILLGRGAPALLREQRPRCPVLVLTPETDAARPNALLALIADTRRSIVKGAGHVSNLEQPAAFTNAVARFAAWTES